MRVAVAGATGVVGRHVVRTARSRGHEVVPLARAHGVDLTTGAGLATRLADVDAVVDASGVQTQRRAVAERFFGDVTRTLLDAEQVHGVGHHVALSIIGIDDVPSGYYLGKRRQEQLVGQSTGGWSILRSAQLHEFAEQALGFARLGPVSLVPSMLTQPVAAVEVAAALLDLVETGPSGRVPELAGPAQHQLVGLARRVAAAQQTKRRVLGVRLPGAAGRAVRRGALCPTSDGPRGTITFDDWLASATRSGESPA